MRPALRLIAGITTLGVAIGIILTPHDERNPHPIAGYGLAAFLLICAWVCAVPSPLGSRLVGAGASALSSILSGFEIVKLADEHSWLWRFEEIDLTLVVLLMGAGTAWYTITGRLPRFLWLLFHQRPSDNR